MVTTSRHRVLSDEELADLAVRDPGTTEARAASSELLGRYAERVYTWCFRHVRDHEQALDLAQEVLVNAYRRLDSFGGRSRFSTWLFAIARNRCLSELRRPALLYDDDVDLDAVAAAEDTPDTVLQRRLGEESVLALIRECLAPREQEALWLRCFERMPVDAITAVLQIPGTSGARAVLQSARRKLRTALERRDSAEQRECEI
jgi:RNA polymerase sigma-70 factor (ECF subfamily)